MSANLVAAQMVEKERLYRKAFGYYKDYLRELERMGQTNTSEYRLIQSKIDEMNEKK